MTLDTTKLRAIVIAVLALFAALYLGITAATAQFETIAWIMGGVTLITCVLLGRRIWMLIPFLGALGLTFRIPGQPTSLLVAQGLFLGFATILFLMRRLPLRIRFTELEFWMLVLLLFVIQVYVRNPVGILLFGGDTVGGKAYIIFAVTLLCSFLFAGLQVAPKELKAIYPLTIIGGILSLLLLTFGFFLPAFGVWIGAVQMSASAAVDTDASIHDPERATRIGFIGTAAKNLSLWICTRISPLQAILRPQWIMPILISIAFASLSGFRNTVGAVGLTYICGLLYRGGGLHLVSSVLAGAMALALLAIFNSASPLPLNIQRSLSFLPGTWEADVKLDASKSTEWRMEIWKEVLLTDRWIQNKVLGDGLGFTAKELQTQINLTSKVGAVGISGFDLHREAILANADYHSGPVQTIRTIGYFGLAALLLAMIRLAVHAHRQIQRCRGTEWFPLALLIGIPLVWAPFFFVFIFGSFQIGAAGFLMGAAMVRMLENNLPLPAYVHNRARVHVPLVLREREGAARTARSV